MKVHLRQVERDLILAYQTGAFSRASKVKPLSYYLKQLQQHEGRSVAAEAIGFFHSLKAQGVPISIKRVPRAA